ncbi:A disintegrin and metalloproteinase with thrombospondin motifs 7 isoform X2 [Tiliqua scincoides]|uniref:A disintegrin and metalloproteinase with thrombospondin motifs 7 isoform X2 n=1 Tax=Tiliqua scincoides TaxID=71010 RepID=UPI003461E998
MQPPPLLALLLAAILCRGGCGETRGLGPVPAQDTGYDVVYPVKVDEQGSFLSYNLSHRWLYKRAISVQSHPLAFYTLDHRGQQLRFNLSLNHHLLAPGFVSERRFGGLAHAKIQASSQNSCHMIGSVQNQDQESGLAALSTCDGLKGVFRLADEDFFIEPLAAQHKSRETPVQPHRIYKRHLPVYNAEEFITVESTKQGRKQPILIRTCGVHESLEKYEKRRERWEEKQKRKRRIRQRSVSKEKWVETLVVADPKMVEYHGSENIERYVLTVMNMVAGLFHDASIGNPIHISVVRLIFLEEEEEDLKITHHADNTLRSFCKWQKAVNVKGDAHPLHHDVAVLLTRKDICAAMNRPCETLGLSHVSGMCQPHRSCNINEDTGLPLAFTVAHELGHSFGIQHDGSGNDCEPVGKRPFVMSPQLLYDTSPLTWSRCSREYITRFLDRGWGLCLDDPPAKEVIDYPSIPPGVLYDVSHQCRLQYGASSTYCDDMDSVCNTLWCSVGNTCHSKLDAAVDGTKCDENKWCFNGECVRVGYRAESINGGWAAWSSWAACSRTCGAGVQSAERQCNSPTPKYGGRYCLGERKRYRVCNMKPCPADRPSFRHIQCSRFDARPYKGKLYKWTPIPNNINPCELHCRPDNEYFAEKLRDAVIDGTLCYQGNSSRDMCINGICKNVGCDYEIDSYAVEDRCGVCRGDGSTCQTVMKTFEEREGLGYVDVGLIPAGAREIHIEEVAEAENFLALRSEDPEKYFLNGGWTIQWNGDYPVAGTTFTYKRTGNWENLTSPGPTEEPVWIQLLFQEKNPGIRYQYTIQRESDQDNEITATEFFWQYGSWTKCTVTCGTGVQRQIVHCVEKLAGIVDEPYCDALSRPDDQQRSCSEEPCPSRWWSGEWQPCSMTCGDAGLMKRTVLCIQSVGLDEQQALPPSKCQHLSKPDPAAPCNREVPCPAQWVPGIWSECSVTCGNGTRQRLVECPRGARAGCDVTQRPASEATCSLLPCSPPDWSGSGSSSQELFNEINFAPDPHAPKLSPSAPNLEDPNAIVEEDFSLGINKKGNVFVDDFYYDYNFINFHEDLSYDPVREKDRTREDLKPDGGAETAKDAQGGSAEVPPSSFPATGPADRTDKGSSASPAVGQKEDPGKAQGSGAPVNLQDAVGVTVPLSVTSSPALSNEGVQPPLRESWPPTPAAMTRHPPASHSHRVSVAGTPVNTFTSPVSEESTEGTVSFTRFLPLTSQAPATSPFGQGSESGTPGSTQGSARGMQDPRNLRLPDPGGTKRGDSFDISQDDHGRPSATRWPVVTDAPTSLRTEEAQVSRGTTAAARTRAWPSFPPPQLSHFADAATKLPPVQEGIESDRTFDDLLSSENPEDDRSYSEGTQDSQPPPISAREDVWAVVSTFNATHEALHPESKILAPHETDSPELQLSAEPTHWEQSKAFPSAWPSGLPPTEQQEPDTRLSQTLFGNRNVHPEKGPPIGAPWISATSSGGLGPSHMSAEHQDPKRNEAPSTIPPATVAAIFSASWETGNWSECSTTCGLGAVWRTVRCSSSTEGDCNPAQKPIPARRCYLRPCSMWRVGNWSKCLGACGAGVKVRDIHCVDSRDQRPLRPFHCQAVWDKPPAQMPCQSQPCLDWYTSSWRELLNLPWPVL